MLENTPPKEFLSDPAILLLGIYAKEINIFMQKDPCTLEFTTSLFTKYKVMNQPKWPITNK